MEQRGVQKLPTVSSFSRQSPRHVVRARRLEKTRPFRFRDPMPRRSRGRAPCLESVSLCWTKM
eukprot:5859511-Prymnesium_polylepis.1